MKNSFTFAIVALAMVYACPSFADFSKYVQISASGYAGEAVNDFPVLVKISNAKLPGVYSAVKNAGADLKFTDELGVTEYPYEVDVWDPSGTSLVWVKVPVLKSNTSLRMYYGDVDKTTNPGATQVWGGYAGVWHLSTGLGDSVANGAPAVAVSPTVSLASGAVGAGYRISSAGVTSGSKTGAIYCPSTASVDYSQGFTVSAWVNNISYSSTWDDQMILATCSGVWEKKGGFCIRANTWPNSGKELMFSNSNCNEKFQNGDSRVPPLWDNNVWHSLSLVWDGSTMTVYIDGIAGNSWSGAITNSGEPLTFGNCSNLEASNIGTTESSAFSWKGGVDECRLTTAVKSADWLRAEYLVVSQDVTTFGEPHDLSGCTVDFSAVGERSGSAPLVVEFQASSEGFSGTVTYKWDFDNDGVVDLTTTDVRFSRVFNDRGTFSVQVSAEDASGHTAIKLVKDYILVGVEVYVDANAVSEGFGTKASPFKTITNAVAKAIGRETIYVRGGIGCSYRFADYRDSVMLAVPGLKIRGCDADWNPATGFADADSMARIFIADDYAEKSYTLKGNKTDWPAPFEVSASDCVISGIYAEFGSDSFKKQNRGGEGMISIAGGVSGTVVENSRFLMTGTAGTYEGAGSNGIVSGAKVGSNTDPRVRDTVIRRCYVQMIKDASGHGVFWGLHNGTRFEENFACDLGTLYASCTHNSGSDLVDYHIVSNVFLNCSNGAGGSLLGTAGNYTPARGEIAFNRAIHEDGVAGRYVFVQHGRQYGGTWQDDVSIHHNTIVGYDFAFMKEYYGGSFGEESARAQNDRYCWVPKIFDNLLVDVKTNIWECNDGKFNGFADGNTSSFRAGSFFYNNAFYNTGFLGGPATGFGWYDLKDLAGTNTTITVDVNPPFVNTTDPLNENYYRLRVPSAPWVTDAWVGDDPSFPDPDIPRYIGAVAPQPGGFAVRIR